MKKMLEMFLSALQVLPVWLKIALSLLSGAVITICVLAIVGCSRPALPQTSHDTYVIVNTPNATTSEVTIPRVANENVEPVESPKRSFWGRVLGRD